MSRTTTAALEWETDVRLMSHPLMLMNFVKLLAITGLIMGALMSFLLLVIDEARSIVPMLELVCISIGVIAVLCVLVCLLFFRNRIRMRFRVDAEGVEVEMTDTRARAANKVAVLAGVLGGRPGVAGAGLIAASNSRQSTVWSAVAKVRYYRAWRTIALSNGWRTIVTLYCTADNYDAVAAFVAHALDARPAKAKGKHKNPLPRLLMHTVLTVIACVPLFGMPDLGESALLPALLVLCFALAALWLIPVLGYAVFPCLVWLAWLEAAAQNEMRTSYIDGSHYRGWDVLSGDDYAVFVAAGLGTLYLLYLIVGLLRGRIRAGLAGDMAEMAGTGS